MAAPMASVRCLIHSVVRIATIGWRYFRNSAEISFPLVSDVVVLPDTMPSRVICDGVIWSNSRYTCNDVDIICSEAASCDILVTGNAGLGALGVDCRNTTHSCTVSCDAASQLQDWRCNSTSSCNCQSSCDVNPYLAPQINHIGDPCYRNLPDACFFAVQSGNMRPAVVNNTCWCECVAPNTTQYQLGSTVSCADPDRFCDENSDCGTSVQGSCSLDYPRQCLCNNPWGGPRCQAHMCPQCKNSAYCSNSTASPCICTGLWTGLLCDTPLGVRPSLPGIPEHAARCNATSYSGMVGFPPAETSPSCPSDCNFCDIDTDGTPVCIFVLPDPFVFVATLYCPLTHRCIFQCAGRTIGFAECASPYGCDFIGQDIPSLIVNCTSPLGCRFHCSGLMDSRFMSVGLGSLSCGKTNGSCFCDRGDCTNFSPCEPGVTCNGDPCAENPCGLGDYVSFNATSGKCECSCRGFQVRTDSGDCRGVGTDDCSALCNNGACHLGKCWCQPGWNGDTCLERDLSVALKNSSAICPVSCLFCREGTCYLWMGAISVQPVREITCPLGWACLFICDSVSCTDTPVRTLCPSGAGPCELWCWGHKVIEASPYLPSRGEFRPFSACTLHTIECDDASTGCRARCDLTHSSDPNIYYQTRTVRAILSGGSSISSTSVARLGAHESGTETCLIASSDICYQAGGMNRNLSYFGFIQPCPLDSASRWLQPYANAINSTCDCRCPQGYLLQNGTCNAQGCYPTCKNNGACQIVANVTHPASPGYSCRCFGGWNGKDCTSRCFFPVTANVTACDKGLYYISGQLIIPSNRSLDLFAEVPDLHGLNVTGNITFGGQNATLVIGVRNLTGLVDAPSVNVSGDWRQSNGSRLVSAVVIGDRGAGALSSPLLFCPLLALRSYFICSHCACECGRDSVFVGLRARNRNRSESALGALPQRKPIFPQCSHHELQRIERKILRYFNH